MEAVFFRLHQRFATTVVRVLPGRVRRYMEYVSLLNAVCLLAALIYLHKSFVNPKSGPWERMLLLLLLLAINRQFEKVTEGCFVPDKVYLFSLEKGFLMLRQDLRAQHGIVATNVTVPIWDDCFGTPISKWALEWVIGYDTVVMNWLISLYNGKGFLYSVSTKELFNLNYADEFLQSTEDWDKFVVFKVGVLFTTVFLFFTTTTLVSFTLRETQERMLRFTFLLQHHIRNRQPYAPLIFTHVVESLVFVPIMVGILFFLFEFFSDQLLAFMVLSVVWMCEVYSVISVRTSTSIRFFPRVVSFYFALFHVYFFSFPFGFSYLALVSTVLFLQHSMLYFWNSLTTQPFLWENLAGERRREVH
ncbi:hypothetical protein JKP88DRAFT_290025 [Tribonema minus]|uniref:Uncharacterized protein n=1 Tax=Tribonema minus TaxID=303371 RepID=A0A835Z245_9STRA|nr:hypothetical protein JKP88DRAFT_290025 [Tribonema minus]